MRLQQRLCKIYHMLAIALVLTGSGCTALRQAEERTAQALAENALLEQENQRLHGELENQNRLTARLQMELVNKEEQISRLGKNEGLAKEIAANTIRTPAASTRVETVAYLAEVTTEVESIREAGEEEDLERLTDADQLLVRANVELEAERYAEASMFAAQALARVSRQDQPPEVESDQPAGVYADFLTPLSLRVKTNSNVRNGPCRSARVIAVAAPATEVIAIGHQGSWVKITLPDGKKGWIFYTLLAIPRELELKRK